jgi:hypothetical protein
MRSIGLGGHNQARGILVDPMDNARPGNPANSGKIAGTVVEQGIYEGSIEISGRGMHDQSGWLVDNDEVLILEYYRKRNILGLRGRRHRFRDRNSERVSNFCASPRIAMGISGRITDISSGNQAFDLLA